MTARDDHGRDDADRDAEEWERYWSSLTPEEQAQELAMMDAHASPRDGSQP